MASDLLQGQPVYVSITTVKYRVHGLAKMIKMLIEGMQLCLTCITLLISLHFLCFALNHNYIHTLFTLHYCTILKL